MIKLMRNLLGDYKVICHEDDDCLEKIQWQYIEQLNAVQEDLGFSLTNKLKKKHIKQLEGILTKLGLTKNKYVVVYICSPLDKGQ